MGAFTTHEMHLANSSYTGWAKKRGHRLMIIILSNLNRFTIFFSLEDRPVKKNCKSVKICQNYGHESVARFLAHPVVRCQSLPLKNTCSELESYARTQTHTRSIDLHGPLKCGR